ncbi:hypothetical protein K402DRAFT_392281 [Aulographum hederae CBS 113979]|uniref:Sodium/calcium exchanger membrane region domain-containing protein n=1 Tax=Aulographum hederae CBS 113979 TaxID=1176131 RepID=A0A6G1H4R7_9PEZI|nr:hypothetical protein K402DRAFT_392281 [Aulographum hederae CBS 113979]
MHRIRSWARAHASNLNGNTSGEKQPDADPVTRSISNPQDASSNHNSRKNGQTNTETAGSPVPSGSQPENAANDAAPKKSWPTRMRDGSKRFVRHTKDALCHSWVNVLLIFVPIGIIVEAIGLSPSLIFAMNAIAVIPLAGLLAHATESVASRLGDTIGALLNVSFGNAVELIIFIIALVKNEIRIVQASLLGSILANLLLILGMAFFFGGLRFREQVYNSTVTQMSAVLLSLSVTSLLLPTAFHASWQNTDSADKYTLKISRGTSVILLLVYILYLLFQLKSHSYMYASVPQKIIDEESHPGVLHDFLNSSSSSDTSSSSDSDDSSGSHTTARRIKRAFRNRRRKSSAASKDTHSIPSGINSPRNGGTSVFEDDSTVPGQSKDDIEMRSPVRSRRPSMLAAINSGDEADTEYPPRSTLVRDFEPDAGEPSKPSKDKRRKHRKHRKHRHRKATDEETAVEEHTKVPPEPPSQSKDGTQTSTEPGDGTKDTPGDLANFPTAQSATRNKRSFPRPALPSLLSQNVFIKPEGADSQPRNWDMMYPKMRPMAIRRANSLPERLNETARIPPREPSRPRGDQGAEAHVTFEPTEGDTKEEDGDMSRTAAVVLLLASTALVAVCAEFLVDAIPAMIADSPNISQAFIGLIILPIVGNAAEHVTAVTVAARNKMDLSIGVAVGSSIQIAIFVTPVVVLLGWCMDKDMSLYFNLFETVCLFVTAFVVNFLILDGRSNYLEGALLMAAYVIIALAAFYYPDGEDQSDLGGAGSEGAARRMFL